jgi:hypothetical protein
MAIPLSMLPTTCEIRRPFGSGSVAASGIACRLTGDLRGEAPLVDRSWTHVLTLNPDVDIRDGITRTGGVDRVTYADGDEVRVPSGGSSPRFVVVWVERCETGTPGEFLRAYLLRHVA